MKKAAFITAICLLLALVFAPSASAELDAFVSVYGEFEIVDEDFTLDVLIDAASLRGGRIRLTYDPAVLALTSITPTENEGVVTYHSTGEGTVTLLFRTDEIFNGAMTLATVGFRVLDAHTGDPLTVGISGASVSDGVTDAVPVCTPYSGIILNDVHTDPPETETETDQVTETDPSQDETTTQETEPGPDTVTDPETTSKATEPPPETDSPATTAETTDKVTDTATDTETTASATDTVTTSGTDPVTGTDTDPVTQTDDEPTVTQTEPFGSATDTETGTTGKRGGTDPVFIVLGAAAGTAGAAAVVNFIRIAVNKKKSK